MAAALSLTFQQKLEPSDGGRPSKVYYLSKRETIILITGHSVTLRAKIIDRWQELEEQVANTVFIPASFAEALRLAADQAEKIGQLEQEITIIKPMIKDVTMQSTASRG